MLSLMAVIRNHQEVVKVSYSNERSVKHIKDNKGNVLVRIHGKVNTDILARAMLGVKQEVKVKTV